MMTRTDYLRMLNDARDDSAKWTLHDRKERLVLGELTLEVMHTPERTLWELLGDNGEMLTHGSCETKALAQAEALMYAEHFVKNVLHPAYTEPA